MDKITRSRVRLGNGDASSDDATAWEARAAFLAAVYQTDPQTYWSLFPEEPGEAAYEAWRDRWGGDRSELVAWWQARWHLTDGWLADVAHRTIQTRLRYFINGQTQVWPSVGSGATDQRWTSPFVTPRMRPSVFAGRVLGIPPVDLHWNPTTETKKAALSRITARVRAELDRIEAELSEDHHSTKTKEPDHFFWLAAYQLGIASVLDIARHLLEENPDTLSTDAKRARAVDKAIVSTSRLIGLTLRRDLSR